MHTWQDLEELTIFGRHQQIAEGFLLRIHLLSGLYGSWSRKCDPEIADQGTDAAQTARMQRRGHGCSVEGTWVGRTREPAGLDVELGRTETTKNQIASRFLFCFYFVF